MTTSDLLLLTRHNLMTDTPEIQDAYERGEAAGQIAERLARHDAHLDTINGSMQMTVEKLEALRLAVQRLGDQAEASAKTVVTTAAALATAEKTRRDATETSWTPYQRMFAVVAAIATLVGVLTAVGIVIK